MERVVIAAVDLVGAAVFATAVALLFVVDGNMEGDFVSGGMVLLVFVLGIFAVLGVIFALVAGCKRASRAWLAWNIAYLILVELPLVALLGFSLDVLKFGFPVFILPVVGCAMCWRLIALQKRREVETASMDALQDARIDEASAPDAVYSNSVPLSH